MLVDLDNLKGKCLILGLTLFIVVAVFITLALIGNPTGSNYEYLTNGTLNETEMIRTGAFAHLASNRDAIGVDKLGQVKKKWSTT